jgi:NAD-dependent dihydropyrimidine dehydrogenase PreA subunit
VVKIVHPKIDYNKCVGLLECYDVCPAGVYDVEETTEGKKGISSASWLYRVWAVHRGLFYKRNRTRRGLRDYSDGSKDRSFASITIELVFY